MCKWTLTQGFLSSRILQTGGQIRQKSAAILALRLAHKPCLMHASLCGWVAASVRSFFES